jgi:hypothetical protein
MKSLLIILFIFLITGCANNKREAIETICKGVKNTGKTCRSAVGLAGKCVECAPSTENADQENISKTNLSTFELHENSMFW